MFILSHNYFKFEFPFNFLKIDRLSSNVVHNASKKSMKIAVHSKSKRRWVPTLISLKC